MTAIAVGKNPKVLLNMIITTTASPAASAAATTSGLGIKTMKRHQSKKQPSGSGDLFDKEGFLTGFCRQLIKRIQTGSRLPKKKTAQTR